MLEPALNIFVLEWIIRVGFSLRVIMTRRPVGTSLAWLAIILLVPFFGAAIYFMVGENRLGYYRASWSRRFNDHIREWREKLNLYAFSQWESPTSDPAQLARLIHSSSEIPAMAGNRLQLLGSAEAAFAAMIDDIQNASKSCNLEYFIWETGGLADDLSDALKEAARRGVECRILVDAVGSRSFLRSDQVKQLRSEGVEVRAALPASLLRALFFRFDLRLHRKITVFDGKIGYVGSQNIADPKQFQLGAGFGQWVDAMVRIEGPAVEALSMTFWEDWQLESLRTPSFDELPKVSDDQPQSGSAPIQVIPSGPGRNADAIQQTLINAIYMADERLVMTTPYFVPDESLQTALVSAVRRGVDVTLVIPQKVNSTFIRIANRVFLRELVDVGVSVALYRNGMLHTKSIVIDDDISLFGSLNLDPRSLHLNFEITIAVYDAEFTQSLFELQSNYISHSDIVAPGNLDHDSFFSRVIENVVRLLAPLL